MLKHFSLKTTSEVSEKSGIAFVFQGRHDVRPGLGQDLYNAEPVFRSSVQRSLKYCQVRHGVQLLSAFESEDKNLVQAKYGSYFGLLLAIIHIALTDLWKAKEVEPEALIGFSMGDRTLHYFNQSISWQDTLNIAHFHEKAHNRVLPKLKFINAKLDLEQMEQLKKKAPVELNLIAEYGPASLILSCTALSVATASTFLEQNGIAHDIVGDAAFHTTQFSEYLKEWPADLVQKTSGDRHFPVYLSAEGGLLPNDVDCNSTYLQWTMSAPALFISAFKRALADGYRTFVMIGADPILAGYMSEAASAMNKEILILESMHGVVAEREIFKASLKRVKTLL